MSHFCFKAVSPSAAAPAAGGSEPCAGRVSPISELLNGLRGQQVSLVVSGRQLSGKLVSPNPVTLVAGDGCVTVVALDQIQAVQY